ncbi:27 kDa primary mesenchyme-specific spicule protein-like [Diadema setosum]|uniref:27 kDa primary mesenchyme-specific spicule protein-like n=1 Tax=Diadema setosum TaxID=31175 RepID=UPI003B3A5195
MKLLAFLLVLPALCHSQAPNVPNAPNAPNAPNTPYSAKCKGGWFLLGQQCFKMIPRAMKWSDAELMCEQNAPCGVAVLGGVMTIPDLPSSNAVISHLKSLSSTPNAIDIPFWTGLRNYWNQQLERYEGWKWPAGYSTTQQPLTYVNWAPGEPNLQLLDQQHSYCAGMNRMGQWFVRRCDEPMYFMCSMPVNPPLQGNGNTPAMTPGMLLSAPHAIMQNHVEFGDNGLLIRTDVGGP